MFNVVGKRQTNKDEIASVTCCKNRNVSDICIGLCKTTKIRGRTNKGLHPGLCKDHLPSIKTCTAPRELVAGNLIFV